MALDEQKNKLFRIQQTVLQMLNDRCYLMGDFEINTTKEWFLNKFGKDPKKGDLVIKKAKRNNPSEQVFVFFLVEAKVGVTTIKTYVESMKSEGVFQALLVVQQALTPFAR